LNNHRLHHPEGHVAGHQQEIQANRDRKLEAAREQRKNRRVTDETDYFRLADNPLAIATSVGRREN